MKYLEKASGDFFLRALCTAARKLHLLARMAFVRGGSPPPSPNKTPGKSVIPSLPCHPNGGKGNEHEYEEDVGLPHDGLLTE